MPLQSSVVRSSGHDDEPHGDAGEAAPERSQYVLMARLAAESLRVAGGINAGGDSLRLWLDRGRNRRGATDAEEPERRTCRESTEERRLVQRSSIGIGPTPGLGIGAGLLRRGLPKCAGTDGGYSQHNRPVLRQFHRHVQRGCKGPEIQSRGGCRRRRAADFWGSEPLGQCARWERQQKNQRGGGPKCHVSPLPGDARRF